MTKTSKPKRSVAPEWNEKEALPAPPCPRCGSTMRLREGAKGAFYGCSKYPDCRGTLNAITNEDVSKRTKFLLKGTYEQEAVWEAGVQRQSHIVVRARAGTGKTWTMTQMCLRLPAVLRIAFAAFNKHIATEAQEKLSKLYCSNVRCSTYHSLGLRSVKLAFPKTEIRDDKVTEILESIPLPPYTDPWTWRRIQGLTRRMVGFAKNYLLNPKSDDFMEQLEALADHHDLDLSGELRKSLDYVSLVLDECCKRAPICVDYDDMIWLPVYMNLAFPSEFDILIVDETQDTNLCQQELALRACPNGRIMIVGDDRQAIYGFRGADVTAMSRMQERLEGTPRGVEVFPLTITQRCAKSHVAMAQALVPDIQALPDAPEGETYYLPEEQGIQNMKVGDLALCRVNRPLVRVAFALIRRGVRPVIRGREIGKGLTDLLEKLEKKVSGPTILDFRQALDEYRRREEVRLSEQGEKASARIAALNDRCDCLSEMLLEVDSIPALKAKIASIFSDFDADGKPAGAVILGTVHRTKGLESERVFVLAPELIPHPMSKQPWAKAQEENLAYVAITRAKFNAQSGAPGTVIFCGRRPSIYDKE